MYAHIDIHTPICVCECRVCDRPTLTAAWHFVWIIWFLQRQLWSYVNYFWKVNDEEIMKRMLMLINVIALPPALLLLCLFCLFFYIQFSVFLIQNEIKKIKNKCLFNCSFNKTAAIKLPLSSTFCHSHTFIHSFKNSFIICCMENS